MTISFSPEAEADFTGLLGYLVERQPRVATELGRRIFSMIDRLARGEFEGPEQTLETGEVVRSWPVPPVRIYYQRRSDSLWILRLYHQARPPIAR